MSMRLKEALSVFIVLLALSPLTAPFSTYDPTGRHDFGAPQSELLISKACVDEDVALIGVAPAAPDVQPVFVLLTPAASTDEISKHQIPSRILRL